MYQQPRDKKYLNIKEAAVRYDVSRAKLHRLIMLGRLHTDTDPRDERARLISSEELEALFGLSKDAEMYTREESTYTAGRLTARTRTRLDTLRRRVAETDKRATDSVEVLREARAERAAPLRP